MADQFSSVTVHKGTAGYTIATGSANQSCIFELPNTKSFLDETPMGEASSLTTDATALHLAIKHGNAETLSRLLNEGSSVTAVNNDGWTALHVAAKYGTVEMLSILLDKGSSVTAVEQYGCTALHIAAIEGKVKMLPILLDRGSSITAVQMYGYTALLLAAEFGTVEMVSILLERGSSVTAVHVYGWTALHLAAKHGTVEMLSILLDKGSSITAVNDDGWTALHIAVCSRSNDTVEKVKLLLAEGAIVNTPDKRGRPELHIAARNCSREVVKLLLDVGANIDVVDTSGNNALSYMLLSDTATFDEDNVAVACFLCSKGSKLKPLAEMPSLQKHQLGLLACIQYWQQRYEHHPLIEVPSEVVNGGEDAVKTYLAEMEKTNADDVVYRRKICVVGPTTWGKSSLARSMIEEQPILVPLTNRTTGIDLFSLSFTEEHKKKRHDITFWDFAGQDVYHVAHAVFFSTRALYLVCINLKAYADMLEQVNQESKWEREDPKQRFFEENILRWMLLILIRQPDAQFKLIGTKADLVNPPSLAKDVIDDVRERLNAFLDNPDGNVKVSPEAKAALRIEVKGDFVATALSNEANGDFVAASVESIQRVKDVIKDAILAKPDRSFQMPTSFTQAFAHIIDKRRVAAASATQQVRMDTVIMPVSDLCRELMRTVGIDRPKTCKGILRTLHELGDVLWYEDIGDEFKELVILDPTVMLDLVREVINHNYKDQDGDCYDKLRSDGTLQHSLLITFPAWKALDSLGGDLVRLFKRLLLHLNLVYPVNDLEDLSEADMIVPTYWKLREQAARPSLPRQGTVLKQNAVNGSCIAKMRYSVPIGVSGLLYENLVIQCYRPHVQRKVRASYFELSVLNEFEAAIYLTSNRTKRYNDITIEVVAVTEKNAWAEMRHFVVSMEKLLLKNYPGLSKVNRYVVRVIDQLHETDHEVNCLLDNDDVESRLREKAPWLPLDFDWFRQRVWRNPEKLETLNMHHRLEVLKRLLITSEKRRFPVTWTISYPEKGSPIELRLHSDVTGKCFHKPLLIPVDNFLKRHSGVLKIGITLLSVASSAIPVPVIGAAVGQALSESRNALEQASATKSIVDKAQLNPGEKKWHNELRMTPEASMAFLRDLLKIHIPQHDEFTIGEACNLRCAVTKDGRFVWVNALEMEKMKDHLDPCEPEPMPPIKPILPINPKPSPSSLKSVSFAITSMAWSSDAGGLSIFAKAYCEWEIVHSSSSQIIREGKTERFKRTNAGVLLKVSPEPLDFVTSIEMLHNCTVKVYLKQGRRLTGSIRSGKELGRGQELLDDHINTDCRTSQTVRIPISVNSGKQSHTVACELDIKFST